MGFFIPIGLLAGSIVGEGIYFMGAAMTSAESMGAYLFTIWGGILSGGIFCYVACYVAPNHKLKSSPSDDSSIYIPFCSEYNLSVWRALSKQEYIFRLATQIKGSGK